MFRKRKNKEIPDKWIDYAPMKDADKHAKLFPFKVPLPVYKFQNNFLAKHKWTPSDVMNRIPDLGLIIDLTFKDPGYYDPMEFLDNGIDYIKIKVPGHIIPPEETFYKFYHAIDEFHATKPDLIVGVHCTHGVNRTGYMICRYLIEKWNFEVKEALEYFASIRGYEVERDIYKQHLFDIHGS